jgi:hypothetical protein
MADKIPERLLRKQVSGTSAGAAYDDLEIGPVPPGEEWYITNVACTDETNAITKRGVAIKSGGSLYWLLERALTTQALRDLDYDNLLVVLAPGESLVCRLTGCTSGDVIRAWAVGRYFEVSE